MSQTYAQMAGTDTLTTSRTTLNNNTDALLTNFAGSSFPTTNIAVGMFAFRSDQNKTYQLKSTGPAVWVLISDITKTVTFNEDNLSALASAATSRSNLGLGFANAVEQAATRTNLYAAPFDAMSYNGLQFNGSMEVNQETTGTLTLATTVEKYVIDGWKARYKSASMVMTAFQDSSILTGLNNTLRALSTTGAAMGTSDYVYFEHLIEGYRFARAAFGSGSALPITISLLLYPTISGNVTIAIRNSAGDRTYSSDVAVTAATMNFVQVTIPGDSSGTWLTTNGIGARIRVVMGCGTSDQGPSNSWTGTGSVSGGTSNTTNFFATSSNTCFVTGVHVCIGTEGPSLARLRYIMRSLDQEIDIAKRYWEKSYDYFTLAGTSSATVSDEAFFLQFSSATISGFGFGIRFKKTKRATPTIVIYSPSTGSSGKFFDFGTANTDVTATADHVGINGFRAFNNALTAATVVALAAHWTADGRL